MRKPIVLALLLLATPLAAQLHPQPQLTLRATFADPRLDPAAIRYSGTYTYCQTDECIATAFCTAEVNVETAMIGSRNVPFPGVVRLSFERLAYGVTFNGSALT